MEEDAEEAGGGQTRGSSRLPCVHLRVCLCVCLWYTFGCASGCTLWCPSGFACGSPHVVKRRRGWHCCTMATHMRCSPRLVAIGSACGGRPGGTLSLACKTSTGKELAWYVDLVLVRCRGLTDPYMLACEYRGAASLPTCCWEPKSTYNRHTCMLRSECGCGLRVQMLRT